MRFSVVRPLLLLAAAAAATAGAQQQPAAPGAARAARADRITIDRIFKSTDFRGAPMPSPQWLRDGRSYLEARDAATGGGSDLVKVDVVTGEATVLAPAAQLVDAQGRRIAVEDVQLSADEGKALLFSNSVRVWRTNTRGVYHVFDFRTRRITPVVTSTRGGVSAGTVSDTQPQPALGQQRDRTPGFVGRGLASGAADPDLQQFAKFSPDGNKVAFVRSNDLYVLDIASGRETRLTTDGSDDVINGTTDWVYEEELGLQDAFRWSPDSRRLAYWRFDQAAVPAFPMVNELGDYPTVSVLRYPKAGYPNSRVTVGVVDAAGGATRWLQVGPDTGQYIVRMDWAGADSVVVQRMPRRQNRVDVLMASAATGLTRTVLTDRDSAYVDLEGEAMVWLPGQRQFLWRSDRSGWRQWYLYDRSGRVVRQVTRDGADVLSVVAVDARGGNLYATAAAPDPTQRQLFRYSIAGRGAPVRVTTAKGSHAMNVSPDMRYAIGVHSTLSSPPTATLYDFPAMTPRRVLQDNARLKASLATLRVGRGEFFKVPTPDGQQLDAWRLTPAGFDSTRKHPVVMYVYGGPASPTVNDAWGGTRYLWHLALAELGYVVVSVDGRGSAWRGRDFRKVTQNRLGQFESRDQIDAARWFGRQAWADASRVGIWGWSYGGYMSTLSAAKGGPVFRSAIAVAPVADWRLYDTIYTERFMWVPQENREGYEQGAPLAHLGGLTASFLLAHGTGDDNVHPQHTTQLADRLVAADKPFEMLLYPNRTHSIAGGNSTAHLYGQMTRFIQRTLPTGEAMVP